MDPRRRRRSGRERGVALLLTLFVVLVVAAVVTQLALSTSAEYAVSTNEVTVARLLGAADGALVEARQALLDDAGQGAGADAGLGGAMGMGGLPAGGGGGAPGGEPAQDADSLNDSWALDQQTTIGGVRVRIHVEDENRKFNLLSLVSKDADFARGSFERLARILDRVREDTDRDLDRGLAETLAGNIRQWIEGSGRDDVLPRPALTSSANDSSVTLPVTIDELLLVEGIDEELLHDQRADGVDYPGLASVLTVWTSVEAGPIPKEGEAAAPAGAGPTVQPGGPVRSAKGAGSGVSGPGSAPPGAGGAPDPALAAGRSSGVKINVNTASPCVLRSLLPSQDLPTDVIDAILRWRNQIDEEKLKEQQEAGTSGSGEWPPGVDPITRLVNRKVGEGESPAPTQYFGSLEDLDKVDEWKNFSNDTVKRDFRALVTTKSDVFSIDVTVRPEESGYAGESVDAFGYSSGLSGEPDPDDLPGGIVKRVRQVVWRRSGGTAEPALLPIVVREERYDRKLTIPDFPIDPRTGYPAY